MISIRSWRSAGTASLVTPTSCLASLALRLAVSASLRLIILCRSPRAARRVMDSVTRFLERKLKLIVNRAKSRVCEIAEAAFLGFTVVKNRIVWSAKSRKRFAEQIRESKRSGGTQSQPE